MRGPISIVIVAVCALGGVAYGQSAEAEAIFREGKKLIKEGKLAEGCGKIEASERIESSTGTLLNLGDCREENKQLASAWAAFAKAATSAKRSNDKKREGEARRRATALEARLGKLVIAVKTKLDGMTIDRGDASVDSGLWNTEVPVDSGAYKITASAPGYESWTGAVSIVDGKTITVDVPPLARAKTVEQPKKEPVKTTVAEDDRGPEEHAPAVGIFTTKRKIALGIAAVGLIGIAAGIKFGVDANDEHDRADKICPMAACGDQKAVDLNDDAQRHATLANISFGIGGMAVAGAVVLWLVGGPDKPNETTVGVTAHGVHVMGRF